MVMDPSKDPTEVKDTEGWLQGVCAALKQVFGTDMEIHVRHGTVVDAVAEAHGQVGRMSAEAESLIAMLDNRDATAVDKAEEALEAIVRDI